MFTYLVIAASLLTVLIMTLLHLPRWISRPLMQVVPVWAQSLAIHFTYGGWIGGVTGHVVGGLLSIPWFFVSKYWLRPMLIHGWQKPALVHSTVREGGT